MFSNANAKARPGETEDSSADVPEDVLKEIEKLPPYVRGAGLEVAKSIYGNKGEPIEELEKRFNEMVQEARGQAKPVRSVKMTPKVAKAYKEQLAYKKTISKKLDELLAIRQKMLDDAEALKAEVSEREERMRALVMVEMGIGSKCDYRFNEETLEIEILGNIEK